MIAEISLACGYVLALRRVGPGLHPSRLALLKVGTAIGCAVGTSALLSSLGSVLAPGAGMAVYGAVVMLLRAVQPNELWAVMRERAS